VDAIRLPSSPPPPLPPPPPPPPPPPKKPPHCGVLLPQPIDIGPDIKRVGKGKACPRQKKKTPPTPNIDKDKDNKEAG
jgi:hypothetical protein